MNIIQKILKGGTKEVIDSVGNVLDKVITNKEELAQAKLEAEKEINRHFEAVQANILKEKELEVQDKSSARIREAEYVKATGHADWMMILVGLIIMLSFVGCLSFVVYKPIPEGNEHIIINAIGILEGLVLSVSGYYFGSSLGSRIKDQK